MYITSALEIFLVLFVETRKCLDNLHNIRKFHVVVIL